MMPIVGYCRCIVGYAHAILLYGAFLYIMTDFNQTDGFPLGSVGRFTVVHSPLAGTS